MNDQVAHELSQNELLNSRKQDSNMIQQRNYVTLASAHLDQKHELDFETDQDVDQEFQLDVVADFLDEEFLDTPTNLL